MRRAGHKRSAAVSAAYSAPSASAPRGVTATGTCVVAAASGAAEFGELSPAADEPETDVLLSPAGTFIARGAAAADRLNERRCHLAIAIRQRIESRLAGRVRDLAVRVAGNTVVLEGKCATYYTKQLAQHAALGVLEHEHLENAIVVEVPR